MDKHRNEMSRRILNFTLEIIYLLTGEEYTIVKKTSGDCTTPIIHESGGWSSSPITEPPPHSRIHEKNNKKKILELIYKMTELLTGEVPVRSQDVTVYFSMEEWEYLEGHKDLYQEVMTENYRPRTSKDGSSRRNPPERCLIPLYSQDCSEENHIVPENHQGENLIDIKLEAKDEAEEETDIMADQQFGSSRRNTPERCPSPLYSWDCAEENHNIPENHQGENLIYIKVEVKDEAEEETDVMADQQYGSSCRNPPGRCPSPLYSQDCPEENHNVPENHQGEDLTNIEAGDKEEERVRGDQPCKCEVEEEIPGGVTRENPSKNSEGKFMLSLNYKVEDEDIMQQSSGENPITLNVHPGLHSTDLSYNFPNHEEPSPDQSQIVTTSTSQKGGKRFKCDKKFTKGPSRFTNRRSRTREKPYSCSECGKCFTHQSILAVHLRSHTGEKPYSCSECGKCFTHQSSLAVHKRSHTGEKPYSCSECGKCFTNQSHLARHVRSHTGEKPYSCSECEKCFTQKSGLVRHQRSHTRRSLFDAQNVGNVLLLKANVGIIKEFTLGDSHFNVLYVKNVL
ncbi:uncharacterized protein LOC142660517 isoform X2 [Rhinoderma darwinii]|uniref:uncharacterized protein LOC142660517 isoform X2 n=1 Tax=Rhinoderma darwinii TaxID=43563 RepID=UPI003F666BA9